MKKIFISAILIALVTTSCKKKLIELENPTAYNYYTYFDSPDRIDEAVVACYAVFLHPGMYSRDYYYMFDLLGNDTKMIKHPPQDLYQFQDYKFDKHNGNLGKLWAALYKMVLRSNIVIDRGNALLPKLRDANDLTRVKHSLGEAKFFRAYAYFQLVTLWGRVPLRKSYEETVANLRPLRSDTGQIWKFVREDLTSATTLLSDNTTPELGRVTKDAVHALFGKVHLYRGNWGGAINEFNSIPTQTLDPDYDTETGLFGWENQKNPEIIFQVMHQKMTDGPNYFDGDQETSEGQATYSARAWEYGFADDDGKHVVVSKALVDSFMANANPGSPDERGRYFFYGEDVSMGVKTTYCDRCSGGPLPFTESGVWWKKYEYYEDVEVLGNRESGINSVVIRYADVLLMLAEAYIQSGNISVALSIINEVRTHGGTRNSIISPAPGNQAAAMRILMRERQVELCGEQSRFFDLVRWGRLAAVLNAELGPNTVQAKHVLLPIPQQERTTNPNVANDIQNDWN